jgi:CDGSH-type Zn-finger protein
MAEPIVAQKAPYKAEVEAGKKYFWCVCGRSKKQPYCDGAHRDTGMQPMMFVAEKTETIWLCGCKATKNKPRCDGTHTKI